jgi:hypothetical protein
MGQVMERKEKSDLLCEQGFLDCEPPGFPDKALTWKISIPASLFSGPES